MRLAPRGGLPCARAVLPRPAVPPAAALLLAAAAAGCGGSAPSQDATTAADPVERGRYLVAIAGCNDCHTPYKPGPNGPEPDTARLLSGHPGDLVMPAISLGDGPWVWAGAATNTAFAGPWGVSFAPNLTPHPSGLGVWTEEMFVAALRTGKHMGAGRPIMPPMPVQAYGQMTDTDLKAVFAYLRSLPPLENAAPEWQPPAGAPEPVATR